jgi:hypothetical protein
MHKAPRESRDLVARHDLDGLLPSVAISAEPAAFHHLAALVDIANREIPGVNASEAGLTQFLRDDPASIFAFLRRGKLLGGVAFLYLNCQGHDALLLDDIDLKNPHREFLARADEEVSAIYTWALAGYGRAMIGLGNVAAHLKGPRFVDADYFAQPSTAAGRDLLIALNFKPIPSFQPDLWRYKRPWNRVPIHMPASILSAGSFSDARH